VLEELEKFDNNEWGFENEPIEEKTASIQHLLPVVEKIILGTPHQRQLN